MGHTRDFTQNFTRDFARNSTRDFKHDFAKGQHEAISTTPQKSPDRIAFIHSHFHTYINTHTCRLQARDLATDSPRDSTTDRTKDFTWNCTRDFRKNSARGFTTDRTTRDLVNITTKATKSYIPSSYLHTYRQIYTFRTRDLTREFTKGSHNGPHD
jgi:hypothetical protein